MKDIAIYGTGGLAKEIACLIKLINKQEPRWNIIGFYDDLKEKGLKVEYGEILGGVKEINDYNSELNIIVAIGSPKIVAKVVSEIDNPNIVFPNIIAPDVVFLDKDNLSIGKGNILCTRCLISCDVEIGDFNIFNGSVSIGHDTTIGEYNVIMPDVKISGEVTIGDRNLFGVGSIVLQQIKIGCDTIVGANSLILRKTKDGMTYVGSPASIIKY